MAAKVGFYAPTDYALMPVNPYLSVTPFRYSPFGLELGVSADPVKRRAQFSVNGAYGTRYTYDVAVLSGVSLDIRRDLTASVGAKYRPSDGDASAYFGVSFKLGSIRR